MKEQQEVCSSILFSCYWRMFSSEVLLPVSSSAEGEGGGERAKADRTPRDPEQQRPPQKKHKKHKKHKSKKKKRNREERSSSESGTDPERNAEQR